MKKLLLLMLAIGFALFPSTALAKGNDNELCESAQEGCQQPPPEECDGRCPVYIGILPTTTTTAAPTTTTTEALPTTTVEVKGQVITQTPTQPSDPGVLPITGGDVLGLTAIGVALAAIGFGLTRARRSEA